MRNENIEKIWGIEFKRRHQSKKTYTTLTILLLAFFIAQILITIFLIKPNFKQDDPFFGILSTIITIGLFIVYYKIIETIFRKKHYNEATQYIETLVDFTTEKFKTFTDEYIKTNNLPQQLTEEQQYLLNRAYVNKTLPHIYKQAQPEAAAEIEKELNIQ